MQHRWWHRRRHHRSPLSPSVRALGIDLAGLQGSGPGGRIVHAGVDAARPGGDRGAAATDGTRDVKLVGLRRVIAQKMPQSKRHIPHFTYVEEVDLTEMVALRDELNQQYGAARGELSPWP